MAQSILIRKDDGTFEFLKSDGSGGMPVSSADLAAIKAAIEGTLDVQVTGSSLAGAAVQNVTTAGVRVQLPSVACSEITIIAKRANTGYIYVGGVTVSSAVYGAELSALDSITVPVNNANEIYIDSSVSGEGISYVAV